MIDPEGRAMTQVLDPEEGKQSAGAAFSADGHEFFVLTYDGQLNVIEAETGEVEDDFARASCRPCRRLEPSHLRSWLLVRCSTWQIEPEAE